VRRSALLLGACLLLAAGARAQEEEEAPETSFADTLVVEAASRQSERVVEAPAAVTVLEAQEIERRGAHGQIPRLLAGTPGVDLAQNGLFDWNFNVRGLNRSTNRRVLVLLDGRDPSLPIFAGGQEWGALGFPLDELATVELVRGPGAALYGANAFHGVLSLITKSPRESRGGRVRLTAGELDGRRADAHWAGELGGGIWLKGVGSFEESDDFTRDRTGGGEYAGLPPEAIAPPRDKVRASWGSLRLDRDLGTRLLTFETGRMANAGITVLTDTGRNQRLDVEGPWARLRLDSPRWSVQGAYTGRDSDREVALGSGYEIFLDETRLSGDAEGRTEIAGGRGRLVGGASWSRLRDDSANPAGQQTLYDRARSTDQTAVFGQAGWRAGDLELVGSLRWDHSDLHDDRLSPRAALVYGFDPGHTLRLSWSVGFQSPALAETYLYLPVTAPLDLSALEQQLAPLLGGTSLGLGSVPIVAVGNPDLELEEVESLELGYTAILGQHALLTANAYRSELDHFTTPLVPASGTSLGPYLSGSLQPWQPPPSLSPQAAQAVLAALAAALPPPFFALLSQQADGTPFIPYLSFANSGRVTTRGAELGLDAEAGPWRFDASYTWFDFAVREGAAESPLAANAPEHQAGMGVSWHGGRFDGALRGRWVSGFDWRSGIFAGRVPSYETADVAVGAELGRGWRAGASVTNLVDEEHRQIFGGDLLGRRALAYLDFQW
jgi:iron complex outermembrane receptor protein